ncbi:MAG: bifunctional pyr operon transcriptional regulator/uracil phosphoribosyltransferase PyrR [Candidatus Hydrogenedentota bacterium]
MIEEKLLNEKEIEDTIKRIANEILDRHRDKKIAIVGIHARGVIFADRVYKILKKSCKNILRGTLDITLYRDDLDNLGTIPHVKGSELDFDVNGIVIILFDDVLFTGRTIRAALDEIIDYGRPAKIELAVLIDRGNRELPIKPDYTGKYIKTERNEYIKVRFKESDKEDAIYLIRELEYRSKITKEARSIRTGYRVQATGSSRL